MENIDLAKVLKSATDLVSVGDKKITLTAILQHFEYLSEHPSLDDIANLLTKWNYNNAALRLDAENLIEIPLPFITHVNADNAPFVVVTKLGEDTLTYFDGRRTHNRTLNLFLQQWKGIVLLLEANEFSGEIDYRKKRGRELLMKAKTPLWVGLLAGALFTSIDFLAPTPSLLIYYGLRLFLAITGLLLSTALMWTDIRGESSLLAKFCKLGSHFDCAGYQRSNKGRLLGAVFWSQVGFLYFLAQATIIVCGSLTGTFAQVAPITAWLNLGASLFILYFFYHQLKRPGKWCLLCTGVQIVLVLSMGLDLSVISYELPHLIPWRVVILATFLSTGMALATMSLLTKYSKAINSQKIVSRFFSDANLFKERLNSQHQIAQLPNSLPGFQFGPVNSANVITFITNPYCEPCRQAHNDLEELMVQIPDLRIKIVAIAASDPVRKYRKIVSHWIAMQEMNIDLGPALSAWYRQELRDYDDFDKRYPVSINDSHIAQADQYAEWAERYGLTSTPAFYFNGRSIPEPYRLQDLRYLINSL